MSRKPPTPAEAAAADARFAAMCEAMRLRSLGASDAHPEGHPDAVRALAALSARCAFAEAASAAGMVWVRDPDPATGEDRATRREAEAILGRGIDPGDPAEWEAATGELTALLGGANK